jgi:glycosyltransferase involved in cell wall biosynthesis
MRNNISIVIPIYNEEEILVTRVIELNARLQDLFKDYEVILTENGSVDNTKKIARELEKEMPRVKAIIDDGPGDYGQALVNGTNAAKFDDVTIFELDYMDYGFLENSNKMLSEYDLIIGSKVIAKGMDQRPFKRKIFTWLYNTLLRTVFRVPLSETHGLKTFKKGKLNHITNGCVTHNAVWPSEFCIRACRDKYLEVTEIPVTIPLREIRTTRIKAMKRLKKTVDDILLLRKSING